MYLKWWVCGYVSCFIGNFGRKTAEHEEAAPCFSGSHWQPRKPVNCSTRAQSCVTQYAAALPPHNLAQGQPMSFEWNI